MGVDETFGFINIVQYLTNNEKFGLGGNYALFWVEEKGDVLVTGR